MIRHLRISTWPTLSRGLRCGGVVALLAAGVATAGSQVPAPKPAKPALSGPFNDCSSMVASLKRLSWEPVGGGLSQSAGPARAQDPALAMGADRSLAVAWDEGQGDDRRISVRRWSDAGWQPLGDPLGTNGAQQPALTIDSKGSPWLAWSEGDKAGWTIHVARWDGKAFSPVGPVLSSGAPQSADAATPSLALDSHDLPAVAWAQSLEKTINVYVSGWQGGQWASLGAALSAVPGLTNASRPSLAIIPSGAVVAWTEASDLHVRTWDGKSWKPLGKPLSAVAGKGTEAAGASLRVDDQGVPVVAWSEFDGKERNIYIRSWSGKSWQPLGDGLSALPGTTDAVSPSLALAEGRCPLVAWSEDDGSGVSSIFVQAWDGKAWQPIGVALSAEPGAQSSATAPSLVWDRAGYPVVAWTESRGGGSSRIHVWRLEQPSGPAL